MLHATPFQVLVQHGRAECPICQCKGCSGHPWLLFTLLPHHHLPTSCNTTWTAVCSAACTAAALPPQPQVCNKRSPTFSSSGLKILTPVLLKAAEPDRATRSPGCTGSATFSPSPLTNSPPSISWLPDDRSSSRSHTPPAAAAPTGQCSLPYPASPGATRNEQLPQASPVDIVPGVRSAPTSHRGGGWDRGPAGPTGNLSLPLLVLGKEGEAPVTQ